MSDELNPVDALMPAALGHRGEDPPPSSIIYTAGRRFSGDALLKYVSLASAVGVLVLLALLLFVLTRAALPSIRATGLSFLTSSEWRANELTRPERAEDGSILLDDDGEQVTEVLPPVFGALPTIYGTAASSVLALLVAVPLSFGTALFLVRAAPRWLAPTASFLVEFLAAIPSIAYGMWGLLVLAPFLQGGVQVWHGLAWIEGVPVASWLTERTPDYSTPDDPDDTIVTFRGVEPLVKAALSELPGTGWMFTQEQTLFAGTPMARTRISPIPLNGRDLFCGSLVLALMIVPIITAVARDVLRQVPRIQIEGTLALGATWWQSCREMLRYSRSALFGAVMLGLARAAGETMAVTMVIGNVKQIVPSPFAPAQTMSSLLANEFAEAGGGLHRAALCEVALVLLVMSLVFNIVARKLVVGKDARTSAAA